MNMSQEMVDLIKYSRWMEAVYAVDNVSFKLVKNAMTMGSY